MERQTKIILIVSGSLVFATALGIGIYYIVKKNSGSDSPENDTNPFLEVGQTNPVEQSSNINNDYQPLIAPRFNAENELSNSIIQLRGQKLYPKDKATGGWDYTNVRSSAEVNTDQGWWDTGNKIVTIYKGNSIGTVISDTTTVLNGYSYRWFKVSLTSKVGDHSTGFVRADTVTFKPLL